MKVFKISKSFEKGGFEMQIQRQYDEKPAPKIIILRQDFNRNCWTATLDGISANMLFGTSTLPTAFTLQMEAQEVRRRIEELNPGCIVAVVENVRSSKEISPKAFCLNEKLMKDWEEKMIALESRR